MTEIQKTDLPSSSAKQWISLTGDLEKSGERGEGEADLLLVYIAWDITMYIYIFMLHPLLTACDRGQSPTV